MQIIQSLLGTQVNTLGQKSYLGYHQPESTPLNYRHSNFIKPLVTSKPLFTPSRLFLARKHQPFIDTLITDDDNFVSQEINTDLPETEFTTENHIDFNLGNISSLLQTQIASNLSNEILPETPIQPKAKTTKKTSQQKSPKKSPSKTQPKKIAKSSKPKKVKQIVDENPNYIPNAEEHSLITDTHQTEIVNLTDNSSVIQQQINSDNKIVDSAASQIKSRDWEDNSTLQRQIADDEPPVITDLPSNLTDVVNESDIRETGTISTQASEFKSNISDLSEHSPVEPQAHNIEEQININNNFTNQQPTIDIETPKEVDILEIPAQTDSLQRKVENSNLTQVDTATIDIIPEENLLYKANNLDENIDNLSDSLGKNDRVVTDVNKSHIVETTPLVSEIISPKSENTENLFTHLDNTQKPPIVSDVSPSDISVKSVNESTTSPTTKNHLETPQNINTENQTIESKNTNEDSELLSTNLIVNHQPDLFSQSEETNTTNSTVITPDIASLNPVNNQENIVSPASALKTEIASSENTNIQVDDTTATNEKTAIAPVTTSAISPNIPELTTSENTNIQVDDTTATNENTAIAPVTTSAISQDIPELTTSENTNIQVDDTTATNENTAIAPVTTSAISQDIPELTTPENTNIQVDDTTATNEKTAIAPVTTSAISQDIPELTTSENTNIQVDDTTATNENTAIAPLTTSAISPNIPELTTSENTNIQVDDTTATNENTAIAPVTTSAISPNIPELTTSENTNIQVDDTTATNEKTAIAPVTTSPILANIPELTTSENTNIQVDDTTATSPKSDEVHTSEPTIIKPETAEVSLTNISDNLPILRDILENTQPTTSDLNLGFEHLDLSTFVNKSDTSESASPQDNEDNSSSIDIEANTLLNNLPAPKGYATGAQVTTTAVENHQPVAPSDTVPAMLTPGEFVINAKDAQKNLQILKHINTGGSPEQMISPSLEVANTKTPEETNFSDTTTKVDSFKDSALQRKEAEPDTSSEPTGLTSPSLGVEIGKQRVSLLNSPQINTVENTTDTSKESSPHYSSPALIFRKTNSTTNTEMPSQWSSIEELLNSSNEQFTNFNLSSVESNWQNSPSSQVASSSAPSQIFTKRLSTPQGFANGGEVTAPDISRYIEPITETIQSPYSSLPTAENDDNQDDDAKLEALAQEIYYRLRQRIEIERERQGKYVGRLPW